MPSTRVWVKQGLESHRSAQVLLVPLGNIPPDVYAKYCVILRRFSTIPMQNLTAPGDWNRQKGPLKHFNWSEGCFNFHFIDKETTDGGPSEWEDYQAYRRVLGAIGVVHFPSCYGTGYADFKELEKQFHAVLADCKHLHTTRIFAFGHSFEQGDYPDIIDPQRDIVFPPEQEFEGGGSTTELHMAVSLYDVAVSLIKNLAADVKVWSAATTSPSATGKIVTTLRGNGNSIPPLSSWYDREEGVSDIKSARRRPGRLHKWIGDTCLLLGSPKDALEHYSQSMSDTKASSDPLWQAGCLEGYAACLAAMSDADHPTVHGDQALALVRDMAKDRELEKAGQEGTSTWTVLAEAVISEKCEEALSLLSRYSILGALEVELCFKTARFHACAQPIPRWDRALAALLRALSVPDMPMHVQLERSIEAAILCDGMGLKRKAALFAHLAAMLCSDFENWNTAYLLARMAGEGYGALLPLGRGGGTAESESRGWLVLRKQLLQWLLAVSTRCGDARASSEYFVGLTELMAALEEEKEKADQYLVTLPPPPSDGAAKGEGPSPPVPLVIEALGNAAGAPTGLPPALPQSSLAGVWSDSASIRDGKASWGERMMRRTTTDGSQLPFPPTPSGASFGNGFTGGSSSLEAFLSTGNIRSPTAPASPAHQRFESVTSEQSASVKKSRKMLLPKSIGRKMIHSRSGGSSSGNSTGGSGSGFRKEASSSGAMGAPLLESGQGGPGGGAGGGTTGTGGGLTAIAYRAALTAEEQRETLSEMTLCTSRLSPEDSVRVQLPGIPRLESARLLHFEGPLALLPGDGAASLGARPSSSISSTQQAASSSLFYNPFDDAGDLAESFDAEEGVDDWDDGGGDMIFSGEGGAGVPGKGRRDGSKPKVALSSTGHNRGKGGGTSAGVGPGPGAELPARWAAGEIGKVVARFSNPLRVSLELKRVEAVLDGGPRVQVFPTSVVLPPKAEFHEVVMFVKPLEGGQVMLRAVSVEVVSLVTLCRVDKWGRGIAPRLRLPPPRTYESLRATFRRPQELVTTETVDIAAAAAAAASAEAEDDEDSEEKSGNLEGVMEDGYTNGSSGSNGVVGVGRYVPEVSSSSMMTTGSAEVKSTGNVNNDGQARDIEADKLREAEEEAANEDDDDQQNEEFVPDLHMKRGETACRKLCVEGVAPLLKVSRLSPATSEALGGEETEELLELVNHSGPAISVMEVWVRPVQQQQQQQQQQHPMALLFSLKEFTAKTNGKRGCAIGVDTPAKGVIGSGLDVALASPAKKIPFGGGGAEATEEAAESVIGPGERLKLALRLCAGLASDRDVVTELLVKYSEKVGAAFHRQLRLPLRIGVKGGVRVCSLRVAHLVDGGLRFDSDADATECLLLMELANDSVFPIFVWREGVTLGGVREEEAQDGGGCRWGIGVTEIPGGSRRCLSLRIPRLSVKQEEKTAARDELRSPVALRPLFPWEKSLLKHLRRETSLLWSTSLSKAQSEDAGRVGEGCISWRRGRVSVAIDRIGDDGRCLERRDVGGPGRGARGGTGTAKTATASGVTRSRGSGRDGAGVSRIAPRRHPEAVPACLLGALLPPVRLTCVPLALGPGKSAGGGSSNVRSGCFNAEDFSKATTEGTGEVEIVGGKLDEVEGGWAARTTVDSFMPVSLLVSNPSPWAVEVDVEVTCRAEGREETQAWSSDDSNEQAHVMWCGMPRRRLDKLPPGSSACHGLVACFLTPGDVSIGFTCRIKVASVSAPYGSTTPSTAGGGVSSKPGVAMRREGFVSEEDSGWHPVMCHLPLKVSVLRRPKAGTDFDRSRLRVHRVTPRVGGVPAYDLGEDDESSLNVATGGSDAPPAELDRLGNNGKAAYAQTPASPSTMSTAGVLAAAASTTFSFFGR